jgi:hypothetical protein
MAYVMNRWPVCRLTGRCFTVHALAAAEPDALIAGGNDDAAVDWTRSESILDGPRGTAFLAVMASGPAFQFANYFLALGPAIGRAVFALAILAAATLRLLVWASCLCLENAPPLDVCAVFRASSEGRSPTGAAGS